MIIGAKHQELPAISFEELKRLRKKHAADPDDDLKVLDIFGGMLEQHHEKPPVKSVTKHRQAIRDAVKQRSDQAAVDRARARDKVTKMAADKAAVRQVRRPTDLPETSKRTD